MRLLGLGVAFGAHRLDESYPLSAYFSP
jgi:hypothetical protein